MLTVATGEKKKIGGDAGASDNARWSPDGKWIAYTGRSGDAKWRFNVLSLSPAGKRWDSQTANRQI